MNYIMKTARVLIFLFIIVLSIKVSIFAGEGPARLFVTVVDSVSGVPIDSATVVLPELKLSFLSDENGSIVMDSLPSIPKFMIITAKGYVSLRHTLTTENFATALNVTLSKSGGPEDYRQNSTQGLTLSPSEKENPPGSEPHRITGRVIDKDTRLPVSDAIVSVAASNIAAICGQDGKFSIDIPAAVRCSLTVVKSGYERLNLPSDSVSIGVFIEIALRKTSLYELQGMDINAGRIEVKETVKSSDKISQITMSPDIVSRLPGMGQADLFRSLQLLPGVNGTNEASSGLYIRGGTPDQNLIILDQVPLYYVDHFYGFFSAFNPHSIEEVTLYKGGFGAQWGGRLSSVVELSSRGKNATDSGGIKAGIGTGLLSSDAYIQIPLKNNKVGTVMIAGRRAMTDIFKSDLFSTLFNRMHGKDTMSAQEEYGPGLTKSGYRIVYQPDFYFWDLNGLAQFNLGKRGKLITTFFASRDYQDNSIDTSWSKKVITPIIAYIKGNESSGEYSVDTLRFDTITTTTCINNKVPISWGNTCIGQEWEQQWSDAFKTRLNLSYSQYLDNKKENYFRTDSTSFRHSDTTSPYDTTAGTVSWMKSKNKITDFSGRLDNTIKISDWNTINAGAEISQKTVAYERDTIEPDTISNPWRKYNSENQKPIHSNDVGLSFSVYAEDDIAIGDKAGLTPGLRFYYFHLASTGAVDPRLSLWYKLFPGFKIKGACGIYTQEFHRVEEEDITGGGKFVWLLANDKLPLEKSQHFIGGLSWEKSHFLFDAETYIKRLSGLLTISERMRASAGISGQPFDPDQLALFEGTGLAKGVDLLAQIRNARFFLFTKGTVYDGWIAYSWSRVENTYSVFNTGNPFPATQDHTHEIKIVNSLEWNPASWSSIDLGAVWMYSTGAPYTAPLGNYELMLLDSLLKRSYMHVSDKNGYRLPDYHRLDISAAWKVNIGTHFQCRLALGVFNIYNRENVLERSYTASTIGGGGGMIKLPPGLMGTQTTVFTAMDRKAMSIMPNAAIEVTAKF